MSSVAQPTTSADPLDIEVAQQSAPIATTESRLADISDRLHYGALLLVLAFSPFEAGYQPIGRFLWATFTNLELVMFILGAAWLFKLVVDPAARLRLVRMPLLLPILTLAGAAVLSTVFGEYRSLGPQFIYRMLMGAMVYASAYEALRGKRRLLVALCTFVGAGAVSAVLGLLEFAPGVNIQPWLKMFKPQPTTVGGELRLSGSFEYANGAAMYFEMALPVLVSLGILFSSRRLVAMLSTGGRITEGMRRWILALLFVIALVYAMALILTFSRAALVGVLISLAVIGVVSLLRRRSEDRWVVPVAWVMLALTGVVMLLSGTLVFLSQPMFRLRLTTENDRGWYAATITSELLPSISAREILTVPVTLVNNGQMTWPASGVLPVDLSYHWLSATDDIYLIFEGLRTTLPHDVSPGETLSVSAIVQAPPRPGDYRLQWDLVHENVTWFSGKQGIKQELRSYEVREASTTTTTKPPQTTMPPPFALDTNTDFASVGRGQLWNVALAMFKAQPLTGVGPDGFRNLYGKYAGVAQWNKNIYTNNTYLEMFTNLGLLGGLAFLWLGGLALWRAFRSVLRQPVSSAWVLGLGATAAVVAFFVHGVVDYFLFATPIYLIFWFLMSVAVNWVRTTRET